MRVRKEPQKVECRMPERGSVTVLGSVMFIADVPIRCAMMSCDEYRLAGRKSLWRFTELL
jgi:hypothetical protein